MSRRRLWLVLALLLCAAPASAATYYVDNSCTFNGTGTTDSCAASGGAAGRFNDLQSAMNTAAAGDTIVVHAGSGDYVTTNGTGYTTAVGFNPTNSGTAGNPITLRNATGERPVIRGCSSGSTTLAACNRATFSFNEREYWRITSDSCPTAGPATMGLHIYGLVIFYDSSATEGAMSHGNEMSCTEVERGYTSDSDGNWSALWVQGQYGFLAHHNNLHDITPTGLSGACTVSGGDCTTAQASTTGVKMFQTSHSDFYRNTINHVYVTQAGGFDCKADCVADTFYENDVRDISICYRVENQETAGGPYTAAGATGSVFRNNLCVSASDISAGRGAVRLEDGKITDTAIYNNTFIGFSETLEEIHPSAAICQGISYYNNVSTASPSFHYQLGDGSGTNCTLVAPVNYNYFTTGLGFKYLGTNYAALSNWVASAPAIAGPFDQASTAVAAASLLFTNSGTGDYTLQAGSPLQSAGHVGGVSGGAAIDVGAYTDSITCVGHLCGAAGAPAPTVLSISPSSGTTAGGTSVTITGTDFVATPTVSIGGTSCGSVHVTSSTQIECVTGATAAATVNVVVTNPDAQTGTLTNGYTFVTPAAGVTRIRWR